MPIQVNLNREHTFTGKVDEDEYTVTFDFPYVEDIDYNSLRELLESKGEVTSNVSANLTIMFILRHALKSCTGLVLEDGNPIVITAEDGTVNEIYQKAVFEMVKTDSALYAKVILAYVGVRGKNSETGAMQS